MTAMETCLGCGIVRPPVEGVTDPYGGASASCWALFNEVTLKDFGEYRYPPIHRLLIDAYMAQHPGYATAAGRRSVVVHLVGLHLALDRDLDNAVIVRAIGRVFPDKPDIAPLIPVPPHGALTVTHVHAARSLEKHTACAREWAVSVWSAWSFHRERVVASANAALAHSFRT